MIDIRDYMNKKILGMIGVGKYNAEQGDDKLTFCNDRHKMLRMKIHEYDTWYFGDGDELHNFYTRKTNIDYNYEPFYTRIKRNYFWSIGSTEEDIKMTHSGIVRSITDSLVNIVSMPTMSVEDEADNRILQASIKDNELKNIIKQEQRPLTLVEGWGAFKINWDINMSDYPMVAYYKAEDVDFVYKKNRVIAIIFKDWYIDAKENKYLLVETRKRDKADLIIEKECFKVVGNDDVLEPIEIKEVPGLEDTNKSIKIRDYRGFLAVPSIYFRDLDGERYGRSIFEGKIDLCDDYDQCFSQRSNSIRKSTPIEYFNSDFLDRDPRTGMTIQPKVYDRKYIMYAGGKDANGTSTTNTPVDVTQPQIQFAQYDGEANAILTEILDGIMSPASLGIDVAKKDNADAQREKEKITVFTRNGIIDEEQRIYSKLCNEIINAYYIMYKKEITNEDHNPTIKYGAFADESYENKLGILSQALANGAMSPKMYMDKLYGDTLSPEEYDKELEFLESEREAQQMMHTGGAPVPQGEDGTAGDIPPEMMQAIAQGGLDNEEEIDIGEGDSEEPPLQG